MATRPIVFGEIPGIEEGQWFETRKEMMPTSFHRLWGAGIDGNGRQGTAAIVLSGGYVDDADCGDEIIYTGAGGNHNGNQVEDQSWENRGNAGLLVSMDQGLPVRVIRGSNHKSELSPERGYTYAGLYSVVDAWQETGVSGYKICRFRLLYCGDRHNRQISEPEQPYNGKTQPERREGTVLRLVRNTKVSNSIKALYSYKCQVCGTAIKTKSGYYAEGAHIRPVGRPHDGEDHISNILCLCPNHHVMFDKGTFSIADNFSLIGEETGALIVHPKHQISAENLKYHRECHGYSN